MPLNAGVTYLVVRITNLKWTLEEEARRAVLETMKSLPHVAAEGIWLYHEYRKWKYDTFCLKEFYVQIQQSAVFFKQTEAIVRNRASLAAAIQKQVNVDAYVQIDHLFFEADWRLIRLAYVIVPVLLCAIIVCCLSLIWRHKKREREDALLLLS